jgi:hypothetical protein
MNYDFSDDFKENIEKIDEMLSSTGLNTKVQIKK